MSSSPAEISSGDPEFETPDLEIDNNQEEVLELLTGETGASFSFQGLRRKLGLHQEKLARTLRRLEDDELVEKVEDGYRASEKGMAYSRLLGPRGKLDEVELIRARLSGRLNPRLLFQNLKGKWFGSFRWLGYSEPAGEMVLHWLIEPGIELRVKIGESEIRMTALIPPGEQKDTALHAAYQLFEAVTSTLGSIDDPKSSQSLVN